MDPNRTQEKAPNADAGKLDETRLPVDEPDNDEPGISPTKPESMPRAEDDEKTWRRSPEYHDKK